MKTRSGARSSSALLDGPGKRRPIDCERSRTRSCFTRTFSASLRPSRASAPHPMRGQPRIGRVPHIRLDDGRVDPHRPWPKPPLPRRLADQRPCQVRHRLSPDAPGELSERRLARHPFVERDPAEPSQVDRVRDLRLERPVSPPVALLEHHQADEALDRDRRSGLGERRAASAPPPTASARRSEPAVPARTATDPAPRAPLAAPSPPPATPCPTTTPPELQRASAGTPLSTENPRTQNPEPHQLQAILVARPDGEVPSASHFFRGK
jgi:hypothetical protein